MIKMHSIACKPMNKVSKTQLVCIRVLLGCITLREVFLLTWSIL
jgi:hypothetical protein